jgi:hypothetical protein
LFPNDSTRQERWINSVQPLLDNGQIERLVHRLRKIECNPEVAQQLSLEADYVGRNAHRMRYPEFRKLGLFVGSSVVEAACKNGDRLTTEMLRHVLDRHGRQCHHRP